MPVNSEEDEAWHMSAAATAITTQVNTHCVIPGDQRLLFNLNSWLYYNACKKEGLALVSACFIALKYIREYMEKSNTILKTTALSESLVPTCQSFKG